MSNSKTKTLPKILITIGGILFVFLVWWIVSICINSTLFPTPFVALERMFVLLGKGSTYEAIGGTFYRLLIAFLISFLLALIFGILAGLLKGFKRFFSPFVSVFRTIPTAALIFILIVLVKSTVSLVIIDFLLMFPILYEAVVTGIKNIDKNVIDALEVDQGKTNKTAIVKVIVPMSGPYIVLGIIQSLGLGMKVSIMSEVLVGDTSVPGLGRMLRVASNEADMPTIFAIAIISIILIALLDILVKVIKKKLIA